MPMAGGCAAHRRLTSSRVAQARREYPEDSGCATGRDRLRWGARTPHPRRRRPRMEDDRFDDWTRALATSRTRRRFGAALAAGAVAALLGRPAGAAAARCRTDRQCSVNFPKCCGGRCRDTSADPQNCGQCNRICDEDEVCRNGECRSTCPGRQVRCGRRRECVDLQTDPSNCGRCGRECLLNETCERGECTCSGQRCPGPDGSPKCCPDGATCCGTSTGCCPREGVCVNNGRSCCPRTHPQWCDSSGACCQQTDTCCGTQCCPSGATCFNNSLCCPDGSRPCRIGGGCCRR